RPGKNVQIPMRGAGAPRSGRQRAGPSPRRIGSPRTGVTGERDSPSWQEAMTAVPKNEPPHAAQSRRPGVRSGHAKGDVVKAFRGFPLEVEVEGGVGSGGIFISVDRPGLSEGKRKGCPRQFGQ